MYRSRGRREKEGGKLIWIWCLASFALGVLAVSFSRLIPPSSQAQAAHEQLPAAVSRDFPTSRIKVGTRGPWGVLEYEKILLRDYNENVPADVAPFEPTHWVFDDFSVAQVKELFLSCPLTEDQKAFLLDTNHWERKRDEIIISPSDQLVLGLSAETKQRLYPILGREEENYFQAHPVLIPVDGFNDWFAESGLLPETVELVRKQLYTDNNFLCLAFDRPLESAMPGPEFRKLFRTFSTARTWRLSLRVTPDADVDALARYWGRGGRERSLRPLLGSLAAAPNGGSISIAHLLPPFPRLRLYTYPEPSHDPLSSQKDCFYSALNFFGEQPDDSVIGKSNTARALRANYNQTEDNPIFGDLLILLDAKNSMIHACVYIAEDFVFTKNGGGPDHPWVLMRMPDVLAIYARSQPVVVHYRQKAT